MPAVLSPDQLDRDLNLRDLADPGQGRHAIQLITERVVAALADRWGCEVRWRPGNRVVPVADNYDNLRYAAADVTRDTRYSRYVDERNMLRSHSTAMVPPALRELAGRPTTELAGRPTTEPASVLASRLTTGPASGQGSEDPDDVLLVCPGIVYRRDAIDRLHTGTPHQLDLWRISTRPLSHQDLDEMIELLLGAVLPGSEYRCEPRVHPYTVDGRQLDVAQGTGWVEVAECGLAHPEVLAAAGLDPAHISGLALGLGLDRLLMLVKGIPDIRLLRSPDPAIADQMTDLAPYRPVSPMPGVRRDLSVAVDADDLVEDLGDRVRDALGADDECVESVEIRAETPCAALPAAALARLGARPDQKNLLVRVVLRRLDRSLTDAEANAVRDRVYAAIHRGDTHQWAAR